MVLEESESSESESPVKALILAGGFGVRLKRGVEEYLQSSKGFSNDQVQSWVSGKPKGLVLLEGKPLADYLLEQLKNAGINEKSIYVQTNSQYYPQFADWACESGIPPSNVIDNGVKNNEERKGPLGDLYHALGVLGCDEPLLVIASDTLVYDSQGKLYDLGEMVKGYLNDGHSRIVAYDGEESRLSRHGIIEIDGEKSVVGFEEKPERPKSNLINASVYLYAPPVLRMIKEKFADWENYIDKGFLEFISFDEFKFKVEKAASRLDIGTLDDVLNANGILL